MRGIVTAVLGIIILPLLIRASPQTSPVLPSVGVTPRPPLKGVNVPAASITITASVQFSSSSPQPITTTKTIDVLSIVASNTSNSATSSFSHLVSTTLAGHSPSTSLGISTMPMASGSTNGSSDHHRTLVIVLSTVLGFVGLVLIAGSLFLLYRYRRGQAPFCQRGATPIDDSEIESWRRNTVDQKRPPPAHLAAERPEMRPILLGNPPGWTWAAPSPTSIQTVMSPSFEYPDSPSFLVKAPNSRIGLTDETIPGADPFVGTVKRQSSRLSKPPPGHIRTKSRRSSTSTKSVGSYKWQNRDRISSDSRGNGSNFSWFDPEDESVVSQLKTDRTSSSNGASVFDGLAMGGLSPRPQPKHDEMYIGRAIG